ncbi:MAG: HD domain-containing protein, partial [Rickettsiales bacterium]|nr:HD domain-containing protein [Rickettsiales bacterium]
MARYQYRHSIDFDADETLDDRGRAILKAAFAVAKRAHAGQSRLKRNKGIQYISHPIMVYDIMRKLGETDPEVLAAAILHDAIEDHSVFRANDSELGDAFSKALYAQGIEEVSDAPKHRAVEEDDLVGKNHSIVDHVMALCRQVTNPAVYGGDGIKENQQHDRIKDMSFNAKKIKIADQAASLICNLTMPNDPAQFTPEKEIAFTEKAHTLGVGIVESVEGDVAQREALKPYASFFGKTLLNVYPLIGTNDTKQKKQL